MTCSRMDGQVSHDGEACDLDLLHQEVQHQEVTMESQAQLILSRIHRLQGRQCQRHLQKHVQAFVRHEQIATGLGCQAFRLAKDRREPNGRHVNSKHLAMDDKFMKQDGMKNIDLVKFAKKPSPFNEGFHVRPNGDGSTSKVADNVAPGSPTITKMKAAVRPPQSFDLNTSQHPQASTHHPPSAIRTSSNLQINAPEHRNIIDCTVGTLKYNLHHLETDYDSDATDSSSGGDSCDESSHPSSFPSYNSLPLNGFASNNSSPSTPNFSRKHSSSISNFTQL